MKHVKTYLSLLYMSSGTFCVLPPKHEGAGAQIMELPPYGNKVNSLNNAVSELAEDLLVVIDFLLLILVGAGLV